MRQKRFSALALVLAVVITLGAALGGGCLLLRQTAGAGGMALLKGLGLVNTRFVGEYDADAVVDAALAGMVTGMGDQWSYYMSADQYADQQERRKNVYVGIGITVSYQNEAGLLIMAVNPGSPAETAGLAAGEILTAVAGQSIAGEARHTGAELVRGEVGTAVALEVLGTDGVKRTVEVLREEVKTDPVRYELRADGIGYIRVANFYDRTAQQFQEAVDDLQAQGATGLIFDMRSNGGGYLSELTAMLDLLLPEGPIFISRDRAGREEVTQSDAAYVDLPMAVLVNEETYSAAEFFAAELQEQGAAVIVGAKTSGKGYSQQSYALPNGGALNVSTAAYFTGKGTSLIGTGLTLDREVAPADRGDAQLDAAVELLGGAA